MADLPDGLISLEDARERFAETEPLASVSFELDPEMPAPKMARALFTEKWRERAEDADKTDPVEAWLDVPELNSRFQLTFEAAQQLGSTCRIPKDYQISVPSELHQVNVNHWLTKGLGKRRLKLLLAGKGQDQHGNPVPLAVAQTRDTVIPFSNLELLDQVQQSVSARFGEDAARHAAMHLTLDHSLEHTDFRLVIPQAGVVAGSQLAKDEWYPVVEVTNSCIGLKQTTVAGGLMRAASLAVVIDGANSAGGFKRLNSTPAAAYAWAGESAGDVLDGLEGTWSNLRELVRRPVGPEMGTFVDSLGDEFRVARNQMHRIDAMVEDFPGEMSMYELAALVARAGNMDELGWRARWQLMTMAGHVVHSAGGRCSKDRPCMRAYPQKFDPPA